MVNLNAITHVEIALFKHGRHMMVYYNSTTRYVVTSLHFTVTTLMAQESLWPEREKEPQEFFPNYAENSDSCLTMPQHIAIWDC